MHCWWGLCFLGEILITVSDLILDLIRSKIGMIDIIPHFHKLVSLTGFTGSLGDHHDYDGCSHHRYDDVEGICYHEYRQ